MKHQNELFFPCLESPRRCYLTSIGAISSSPTSQESGDNNNSSGSNQHGKHHLSYNSKTSSLGLSNTFQDATEWELQVQEDGLVALKSVKFGVYLTTCWSQNDYDNGVEAISVTKTAQPESPPPEQQQLWDMEMVASSEHMGIIVKFRNQASGRFLACSQQRGGPFSAAAGEDDDDDDKFPPMPGDNHLLWRLEFQTGELCFLSNADVDRRLQSDLLGRLSLETNWKGWEVWRFIDVGNYELVITSWAHATRVLASNWDGQVFTTEDRHSGFGTRWRALKGFGNGVLLQSVETGRYLRVHTHDGDIMTTTTVDRPDEDGTEWQLESANRNMFYLAGRNENKNRLLSCNSNGGTKVAGKPSSWELWQIAKVKNRPDKYEIVSSHFDRHLGVDNDGNLVTTDLGTKDTTTTTTNLSESYQWEMELSASGGYIITSAGKQGCRLCYDGVSGCWKVACSPKHGDWEFDLHPKMPNSISAPQIGAIVGASVGAIALTFAAPIAFTWGVAALGFGAEGIAAGSVAAGMMSAEALASGGGVVAGGLVSTLQSIGAAGLGFVGTSAAMGSGALVGTAGLGITTAIVSSKDDEGITAQVQEEDELHDELRLPLAAWRSW